MGRKTTNQRHDAESTEQPNKVEQSTQIDSDSDDDGKEVKKPSVNVLTVQDLKNLNLEHYKALVDRIAVKQTVTLISGDPAAGKTTFMLELARAVASGEPFLGMLEAIKGNVLYLDRENPLSVVKQRIEKMDFPDEGFKYTRDKFNVLDSKDYLKIMELASEADMLVFDSLVKYHYKNENKANEVSQVLDRFRAIAIESDCSVNLIHQRRKPGQNDSTEIYTPRGSMQFIYDADISFTLRKSDKDERILECIKNRLDEEPEPMKLDFLKINGIRRFSYSGVFDGNLFKKERALNQVPAVLQESSGLGWKEIQNRLREKHLDIGEALLREVLRKLEESGIIYHKKGGRGKKLYYLTK